MAANWTQVVAAQRLGVTQAYLSMVECGKRDVSSSLAARAIRVLSVPATVLPIGGHDMPLRNAGFFQEALGTLGYPGFAYLKSPIKLNPAELLMAALDTDDLDSRVVEGLPWVPFAYPKLDWDWLGLNARMRDRQNRLGFVVEMARQVAGKENGMELMAQLAQRVAPLERSRLAREDTLCKESMTQAERKWLRKHQSRAAAHWNLLTDLTVEQLDHAYN